MDPIICLRDIDEAIADVDVDAAREGLAAYATWRRGGGYEPTAQDVRLALLFNGGAGDAAALWMRKRLDALACPAP